MTRNPYKSLMLGIVGITVTIIGLSSVVAINEAHGQASRPPIPVWMYKPCAAEGSVNCYWNAQEMGNDIGHSYYIRQFPGKRRLTCVMYSGSFRSHDYCFAENPPKSHPRTAWMRRDCSNTRTVGCFHAFETREFPAWYTVRTPLRDPQGDDDLGHVVCHFYVNPHYRDGNACVARGLHG